MRFIAVKGGDAIMRVKFETKIDNLPKLKATLAEIDGKKVSVGVRGQQAWL